MHAHNNTLYAPHIRIHTCVYTTTTNTNTHTHTHTHTHQQQHPQRIHTCTYTHAPPLPMPARTHTHTHTHTTNNNNTLYAYTHAHTHIFSHGLASIAHSLTHSLSPLPRIVLQVGHFPGRIKLMFLTNAQRVLCELVRD